MQNMRRQLYSKDHDIDFVKCTQVQLKDTEKRIGEGRSVLLHLQNQLIDVACDDPGAAIVMPVALPILQVGYACIGELCVGDSMRPCLGGSPRLVVCPIYPGLSALQGSFAGPKLFEVLWCATLWCLRAP